MPEIFKIKNRYLSSMVQWLQFQSLDGQYSRARTRFIKKCQDRLKEVQEFYTKLMEKFIEKEKGGKFKVKKINENEVYSFKTKDEETEYLKEVNDLYDEEFVIEINEENKKDFKIVKNIILNTDYKFGPKDSEIPQQRNASIRIANEYDEWCLAFENIKIV